jgi:hypothetical protein
MGHCCLILLFDIDEYRKFRHVLHHKYGDQLKLDNVLALANRSPEMLTKVRRATALFTQWLIQQTVHHDEC